MALPGAIGLDAMTIANCCGIVFSAASGVSLGRLKSFAFIARTAAQVRNHRAKA